MTFDQHIGMQYPESDGETVSVVQIEAHHLNPTGNINGGVFLTMADNLATGAAGLIRIDGDGNSWSDRLHACAQQPAGRRGARCCLQCASAGDYGLRTQGFGDDERLREEVTTTHARRRRTVPVPSPFPLDPTPPAPHSALSHPPGPASSEYIPGCAPRQGAGPRAWSPGIRNWWLLGTVTIRGAADGSTWVGELWILQQVARTRRRRGQQLLEPRHHSYLYERWPGGERGMQFVLAGNAARESRVAAAGGAGAHRRSREAHAHGLAGDRDPLVGSGAREDAVGRPRRVVGAGAPRDAPLTGIRPVRREE